MKKIIIVLITLFATHIFAQNVGINTSGSAPDASAMLDVSSTSKGVLVPRVALTDITVAAPITSPLTSLLVYNTTTSALATASNNVIPGFYYWDGSKWVSISGGTGGKDWALLGNAGTVDGTNFLGTTDNIPLNFRVNGVKAGRIDHLLSNTFLGYQSPNTVPTGSSNTGNGALALTALSSGSANVAQGHLALSSLTTGSFNVANGVQALNSLVSGTNNVAIGFQSLKANTGHRNSGVGYQTLLVNTVGTDNSAFGNQALQAATSGSFNVADGSQALFSLSTGSANVADGYQALYSVTSGSNNVAVGYQASYSLTTASNNCAFGYQASYSLTTGTQNSAFGYKSLNKNTGNNNTAMGFQSLTGNTTGTDNSAFGLSSLAANTTGVLNVAVGKEALLTNSVGNFNTAVGGTALKFSTANDNTAVGMGALTNNLSGSSNVAIGKNAATVNTTGSSNTYIGATADSPAGSVNLSNVTSIGFGALTYTSNTMQLGNSSVVAVITSGNNVRRNPNQIAINASATAAASDIVNGYITSTSAAAVNITLPPVALIATQLGGAPVRGTTIDFVIDNSAGANSVTLVLDPSITTAITPAIAGGSSLVVTTANYIGMFRLVFTSGTAAKIFRVY